MNEVWERELQRVRDFTYRFAWASMLMALHELKDMGKDDLQHIAARTVEIHNDALSAEELAIQLKAETGFDIHQPTTDYVYDDEEAPA